MKEGVRESLRIQKSLKNNRYFENTIWLKISKAGSSSKNKKNTEKLENAGQLIVSRNQW